MKSIVVENLRKSFPLALSLPFRKKEVEILKGLNFQVEQGKITGFLGANGVGKTTTLKCLFGLIQPTSGSYSFFDQGPLTLKTRKKIGFLPERPYFYEYLTGWEFLKFYGQLSWTSQLGSLNKAIDRILKQVDLEHAKNISLRAYSKGMLQRIGFAQAILHQPELIVLDEPMAGLDPDGRAMIRDLIRSASQKSTVFFSSHLLHDVENLCEDLVILDQGDVAYQGTLDSLLKSLGSSYELQVQKEGKVTILTADHQEELHILIQKALKDKSDILAVSHKTMSLEDAFLKLFLRKKGSQK